jgi:hypothetical protein
MCSVHEAAWYQRHHEALARHAKEQGYELDPVKYPAPPVSNSDLL